MSQEVLDTIEDGVAIVALNRPDSMNALNPPMMRALTETVRRLADDAKVRCLVLTGQGRGFCAGGDMKASANAVKEAGEREQRGEKPQKSIEEKAAWLRRSMEAPRLLHDMHKPTIAMINGACAGAGLALAGACDLRFAAQSAVFVSAFARSGLSGDYGGSWFWTQILGTAKARELYFLSKKMDAEAAKEMGLLTRVFEDESLLEETIKIAKRLAEVPGIALAHMKQNLNAAESSSLEAVLDLEAMAMMLSRQALGLTGEGGRKQQTDDKKKGTERNGT